MMKPTEFVRYVDTLPDDCIENRTDKEIRFHLPRGDNVCCPGCGSVHTYVQQYRPQNLHGIPNADKQYVYNRRRYRCQNCGKTFVERSPFLAGFQRRIGNRLRQIRAQKKITQRQVIKALNMKFRTFFAEHVLAISESTLQRLQSLSQLTDVARDAFEEGRISKSVAAELAALDQELQNSFVSSIRAGRLSGTLSDLAAHLKASNPAPEAETEEDAAEVYLVEEGTVSEMTHESSAEDEAFTNVEEAPDQAQQQEGHTAYEVTSPVISSYTDTEDDSRDEIAPIKENTSVSDVYEETQEMSTHTLLEEAAGQKRLPITEEQSKDYNEDAAEEDTRASNLMTSHVDMTTEEAAEIILNLCDELGKKCRDKEVIALTKALMSLYTMDDLRQDANERHMPLRSFLDKCIGTAKEGH